MLPNKTKTVRTSVGVSAPNTWKDALTPSEVSTLPDLEQIVPSQICPTSGSENFSTLKNVSPSAFFVQKETPPHLSPLPTLPPNTCTFNHAENSQHTFNNADEKNCPLKCTCLGTHVGKAASAKTTTGCTQRMNVGDTHSALPTTEALDHASLGDKDSHIVDFSSASETETTLDVMSLDGLTPEFTDSNFAVSPLSPADELLRKVYGDHLHDNDGCHLTGGISAEDNAFWISLWNRIVSLAPNHYYVPHGTVGRRFITILVHEFRLVRFQRIANSERPIVFVSVILQKTHGVRCAKDIRQRLTQRMDLWEAGAYEALVNDTELEANARLGHIPKQDIDTLARTFNVKVLSGRLRSAVRTLTNRNGSGVLLPTDTCSKTGETVLTVLQQKHPALRDPPSVQQEHGAFEPYDSVPPPVSLHITSDIIERVSSKLSGAAGPGGTDAVDLRNWLLRFGAESDALRNEMAHWANWLANSSPPWASYRALMAGRLIALSKDPGVRPVGIGEIYRRLFAKAILYSVGKQATAACGNFNLCAGLPAGIEGAVHAVNSNTNISDDIPALPKKVVDPPDDLPPDDDPPYSIPLTSSLMTQTLIQWQHYLLMHAMDSMN